MFEDYKERNRVAAAKRPVPTALLQGLAMGIFGAVLFQNVFAGIAGGLATFLFAIYWWRPAGPGPKRLQKFQDQRRGESL